MNSNQIRIDRSGVDQYDLDDLTIRFLVSTIDTRNELCITKVVARREVTIEPVIRANDDVLIYVCQGDVEIRLLSHVEKLTKGDVALVPRCCGHVIYLAPSTAALVAFSPGCVELPMKRLAQSGFSPFGSNEADRELPIWDAPASRSSHLESRSPDSSASVPTIVFSDEGEKYWLAGDEYTIKVSGWQTQGKFCVVHFLIPPGGGPVPHIHLRDEEVFHILSGEARFYANGAIMNGSEDDTVFLPRGIPHAFRNESSTSSEFLTFVAPAGFDDFVRNAGIAVKPGLHPPSSSEFDRERLIAASRSFGVKLLPEIHW